MKALDVGGWKNEKFKGERVPTFREFLELFRDQDEMLFNIELKDYPAASGDFAYRSAAFAIAMMDEYGITEHSVVNTWSGELNEWLAATYGTRLKIHATIRRSGWGRSNSALFTITRTASACSAPRRNPWWTNRCLILHGRTVSSRGYIITRMPMRTMRRSKMARCCLPPMIPHGRWSIFAKKDYINKEK